MVKLRKSEERTRTLSSEVSELRAAVDTKSGPWFDDVRETVRAKITEGMAAAEEFRTELKNQAGAHQEQMKRLGEEKEQLAAHLSSTLSSCQQLESDLQQSQCALIILL